MVHDSTGGETERLLRMHPLAGAGVLRHVTLPPASAPPARKRNIGWRAARAPLIAFTDDDCAPPPDWLDRALAVGRRNPGAIVQGATRPDPREENLRLAPHHQTNDISPPSVQAETCNIVYPRAVLEAMNGFDEATFSDDTDLALRARAADTPYVAAQDAVTYHAVHPMSLVGKLRWIARWKDVPSLVKRHPHLRRALPLWIFWRRTHAWLPVAVAGAWLARNRPAYAALVIPWVVHAMPDHGPHPRGRLRSFAELPAYAVADLFEFVVLLRGSVKHRTVLL